MRVPEFIGASERSQSVVADCQKTINYYLEPMARGAKNTQALYPSPGFTSFLMVSDIGTRALFTMNDRTLAVIGAGVYGVTSPASATRYDVVTQDNNPAQIVMNGAAGGQALISSGTNGYSLNLTTNVLTQVLTGDCVQIGFLDTYGLAFNPVTSRFRLSDQNDFTTWDPTQFAGRSDAPDNWKAMAVNAPDVWLIGSQSGSVWYDSGDFPFPFQPRPGANFKFGTPASFSIAVAGDSVLWLSQNAEGAGIVVQARGYTPVPISTPAVETRIATYLRDFRIDDAEGLTFQLQGHTFYALRFPSAGATEVFDATTGQWFEWGKWIPARNAYDVWTPRCHTFAFGKHLIGDNSTGQLSVMDVTFGTEADGTVIRRQRIAPSLFHENQPFRVGSLEIFLEMGLGTSTGQGSDPMVMLDHSDDGGKTYGRERQGSAGKIGEYKRRLRFNRMGISSDRVYRLTATDPIPYRIIDAFLNNAGHQST